MWCVRAHVVSKRSERGRPTSAPSFVDRRATPSAPPLNTHLSIQLQCLLIVLVDKCDRRRRGDGVSHGGARTFCRVHASSSTFLDGSRHGNADASTHRARAIGTGTCALSGDVSWKRAHGDGGGARECCVLCWRRHVRRGFDRCAVCRRSWLRSYHGRGTMQALFRRAAYELLISCAKHVFMFCMSRGGGRRHTAAGACYCMTPAAEGGRECVCNHGAEEAKGARGGGRGCAWNVRFMQEGSASLGRGWV